VAFLLRDPWRVHAEDPRGGSSLLGTTPISSGLRLVTPRQGTPHSCVRSSGLTFASQADVGWCFSGCPRLRLWGVELRSSGPLDGCPARIERPHVLRSEWTETLVLLDAGTGLRRLVTEPSLLEGIESVQVLLSHFHLDHVVGLTYLSALPSRQPVQVFGPGRWLYETKTQEVLGRLITLPSSPIHCAMHQWSCRSWRRRGCKLQAFLCTCALRSGIRLRRSECGSARTWPTSRIRRTTWECRLRL
jgi:hypothetical protein